MGIRFRKIFTFLPGVRLNLSKSGASVSLGRRGATVNIGTKGVRETVGLPGSGVSYSEYQSFQPRKANRPWLGFLLLAVVAVILLVKAFG